jgi:hypothetical protein
MLVYHPTTEAVVAKAVAWNLQHNRVVFREAVSCFEPLGPIDTFFRHLVREYARHVVDEEALDVLRQWKFITK